MQHWVLSESSIFSQIPIKYDDRVKTFSDAKSQEMYLPCLLGNS